MYNNFKITPNLMHLQWSNICSYFALWDTSGVPNYIIEKNNPIRRPQVCTLLSDSFSLLNVLIPFGNKIQNVSAVVQRKPASSCVSPLGMMVTRRVVKKKT